MGEFVIRTDHKSLTHLDDQRLHTDWEQKALTKLMGLHYKVVYKNGNLNGAADVLSRKLVHSSEVYAATTVQPTWLDKVVDSYDQDSFVQEKLQQMVVDPSSAPDYSFSDGLLRY
jgi:hypothetical protein